MRRRTWMDDLTDKLRGYDIEYLLVILLFVSYFILNTIACVFTAWNTSGDLQSMFAIVAVCDMVLFIGTVIIIIFHNHTPF